MSRIAIVTTLLILLISLTGFSQQEVQDTAEVQFKIDNYLKDAKELHNIPGLAVAVIQDGDVIYEKYLGKASLESDEQVDENTLFRIFSATKLITATAVFQLIQDGKLNQEDKLSTHLSHMPLHWQDIQIKNLLSHSSGLPDFIRYESTLTDVELLEKLASDKMEFETGSQFRYNQTNYWLLGQIIEKLTGNTFDKYVLDSQFKEANSGVLFSSNSQEEIANRATRYFYNGKFKSFEKDKNNSGKRGHPGNGLNISLKTLIEWNIALDNNQLLDKATKAAMWTPFDFTNKKDDFLHGWAQHKINSLNSIGFTGGNLAGFRKFVNNGTTIILLSNGYEIPAYDIIINDISRITIPELRSKSLTLEENVLQFALSSQLEMATSSYSALKKENRGYSFDNLKWNINSIGNSLAYQETPIKARQMYEFNLKMNPDWWLSAAGIAETYEMQKDSVRTIINYKKAILLNTDNQWGYNEHMEDLIQKLKKE
ncbi:MAG: serine hydrolase domain-containing protein [Saprospiraceae bacterium]